MNQEKIGKFIKELRVGKKLTQEQMAERLGVSNKAVSRWENGRNMPDISTLIELAEFLEVRVDEILEGKRSEAEVKEYGNKTILKIYDFSKEEFNYYVKIQRIIGIVGTILLLGSLVIESYNLAVIKIIEIIKNYMIVISAALFSVSFILTTEYGNKPDKLSRGKRNIRMVLCIVGIILIMYLDYRL